VNFPYPIIYEATMKLLPERMGSAESKAMLMAIGMQESKFEHRKQINGPAMGFWQFELTGIQGVLRHQQSRDPIRKVLKAMGYSDVAMTSYHAIEHNDILACAYARCLLWTVAGKLPGPSDHKVAWDQYLFAWRPGKPHSRTWRTYFDLSWSMVLM